MGRPARYAVEIAITQYAVRTVKRENADPPRALSKDEIRKRRVIIMDPQTSTGEFSDGRVGSFSELAEHEHGGQLSAAAANALIEEFRAFVTE